MRRDFMRPLEAAAILFVTCWAAALAGDAAQPPPVAPVPVAAADYPGTKVADPYRYFEDFKTPEVQACVRAQGEYAEKTLHSIPGRDTLLARVRELDEAVPYRIMTL